MEVMDAIRTLYSCRKYLDLPVELDKLGQVLEAGRISQSAGNLQNWRFVLVRDPTQRRALSEAALQQHWMEEAPVHIVICSEVKRITDYYGVRGERLYAVQNCAVALSNMMLVANSIGLGCCWVGAFDEEAITRICSIPTTVRPQAILTLGYSADNPKDQPKYRIENITYLEKYWNRVGDIGTVLWDFRIAERGAAMAKKMAQNIEKLGTKMSQKAQEEFKKKQQEIKKKNEEKKKKEGQKHIRR